MAQIKLPKAAGAAVVDVDWSTFPDHIKAALMLHGLQQKVADGASGDGKAGVPEAEVREACMEIFTSLQAGTWAKKGGGPRATTFEAWLAKQAEALAKDLTKPGKKHAGKDPAKVAQAYLTQDNAQPWRDEQRATWDDMQKKHGVKKLAEGLQLDI